MPVKKTNLKNLLSTELVLRRYERRKKGELKQVHVRVLLFALHFSRQPWDWFSRGDVFLFGKHAKVSMNWFRITDVLAELKNLEYLEERKVGVKNPGGHRLDYRITSQGHLFLTRLEKEIRGHRFDRIIEQIRKKKYKKMTI